MTDTSRNPIDVAANRAARKWTRSEQACRLAWVAGRILFRLMPRPLWGARRMILRAFGARIGAGAHIYPDVRISMPWNLEIGADAAVGSRAILYALGPISIGPRAAVSQGAHLCAGTHDLSRPDRPLLKPPIRIGADAWICADAFIGPGVTVGDEAVVGARCVAMRDVPHGRIVVGNPARDIGPVTESSAQ